MEFLAKRYMCTYVVVVDREGRKDIMGEWVQSQCSVKSGWSLKWNTIVKLGDGNFPLLSSVSWLVGASLGGKTKV